MGCDTAADQHIRRTSKHFNPRTHMGCDTYIKQYGVRQRRFQSTHPHGVRQCGTVQPLHLGYFNPRTHMGCDRTGDQIRVLEDIFQSTHPHGVRHSYYSITPLNNGISIHAPTWGATPMTIGQAWTIFISIHAPTWGATFNLSLIKYHHLNFNPRTHMGCDELIPRHGGVSKNFNPRTHMGCDCKNNAI